eukprot:TRINITY_DN268_c0_g1_i2.p1 TRINITY_DN268_c0_g1~~TRINITY_DN268_c0_g1_i2.p1  ORF type:complete len:293 (-),score=100.73 TRINITY_DN268_c0_g1_i2:249-1127(-)
MPKSKRNKVMTLAKTSKKGRVSKEKLVNQIREAADEYKNIFVIEVQNMRNSSLKELRAKFQTSRFFFGKNKVMAVALGRSPQEEYRKDLHQITEQITGNRGLFFTNSTKEEIISFFSNFHESDFARSGQQVEETISLPSGPLSQFSHPIEPHLRKLGMPTQLKNGVIQLLGDHTICKLGDTLTPEQAKLLKLFGYKLAHFQIQVIAGWSDDTFEYLAPEGYVSKSGGALDGGDDDDVEVEGGADGIGAGGDDDGSELSGDELDDVEIPTVQVAQKKGKGKGKGKGVKKPTRK